MDPEATRMPSPLASADDANANDVDDLFAYLDELPYAARDHKGHGSHDSDHGDDDVAAAYIDVTIPWDRNLEIVLSNLLDTTQSALKEESPQAPALDHLTGDTDDQNDSSNEDVAVQVTTQTQDNHARAANGTNQEPDHWRVDLHVLLVSTNATLEKFHKHKWSEAFTLHKLLAVPSFHAIRIAGDDRALYECFYRAFSHDMVTKARFVSVLRTICGVNDGVRRKLRREETELCRHLGSMQYTFERAPQKDGGHACVNWRLLLSVLRMFQEPLLPMKEHLKWTFSVFASSGFLERKDADTVDGNHVAQILTHFLRNHAATRFVSERIRHAVELLPSAIGSSTRMSYRRFQALLQQPPLLACFERATPHTSYLDELANPVYRDFAFRHRKREHNICVIKRLRYLHTTRALRHCFFIWTQLARIRKRTRQRMMETCGKLARIKRMWAFFKLKHHAIVSIAAIEIQRTFRGYLGRCAGEEQWKLVQAAIKVQGAFRMRSHFVKFLQDLKKRSQLAIRIQRVYRGRRGRIATRTKLLAYYYSEVAKLQRERDAFRAHVRECMAKRLQRFFHSLVREKRERCALEEAFLRHKFEHEMHENAENAIRATRRYRHDVTKTYDKLREDAEYRKKRKQIDDLEKQKVLQLRRQRQWDAFKQARDDRKAQIKLQCAVAHEQLQREWEARIAERAQKKKLFVSQVLLLEEPGEWKPLQQQLKRSIKEREKALSAKCKASGVAIPKRELEERAQLEIVAEEQENERKAVAEDDWRNAEAAFLNKLDEEEEERVYSPLLENGLLDQMKENAEERVRREKSAIRVQCAFRMFAARKILRQEIRALVVKEFDVKKQTALYRNTFSGEKSLRKPFGLGSEELEFPDQWFFIEDSTIGTFD
uniref:Uncharacterized protein n=1 Tax=Globisporangium ultimum (strain ATCC 200006 / CBS 805.95 / DAOM BR144) TaxID=431595 RepID=K3X4E4_GLOUD